LGRKGREAHEKAAGVTALCRNPAKRLGNVLKVTRKRIVTSGTEGRGRKKGKKRGEDNRPERDLNNNGGGRERKDANGTIVHGVLREWGGRKKRLGGERKRGRKGAEQS